MAFRTTTVTDHVVELEQDGDDVNIMVNGNVVAWFCGSTNTLRGDSGTLLDTEELDLGTEEGF